MADLLYPVWMRTSRVRFDFASNTEAARSVFSGAVSTVARAGDRLRAKVATSNASDRATTAERAILKALYGRLRGQANRLWITDPSYRQRGSFPSQELLTNGTFANGTTGWNTGLADTTISVSDLVLRGTLRLNDASAADVFAPTGTSAVTQYAPYVARYFLSNVGQPISGLYIYDYQNAVTLKSGITSSGFSHGMLVSPTTSMRPGILYSGSTGPMAAAYIEASWASLSRCALINNSPNTLLYSDQFNNAPWTLTRATVTPNSTISPDGSTTADSLIEDATASNSHFIYQTSTKAAVTEDWCGVVCAKANTRTEIELVVGDTGAGNYAIVYFNLSTGAVLSGPSVVGTALNARAHIVSIGNGWYRCYLTASLPSTITTGNSFRVYLSSGGSNSYSGDGSSGVYLWRAGYAKSSVPFIPAQTTSAASTGASQTGASINLKGLPASTNGLLLMGDWVQIGTDLNMVVASLDSDAAGCGVLQLYRPLRTAPADNDPVIINSPMGRFVATSNESGWDERPGAFADFEREFEESLDQ